MRSLLRALLALCGLLPFALAAQTVLPPNLQPCGFDAVHQHLMQTDPAYQARMLAFETAARNQGGAFTRSLSTYKIPVVVHVLETGNDLTNITDDQVRAGIKALNERFRKVPGTAGAGAGVDVGIEFVLAVRDPNGSCTNGITRTNMTGNATYMASGVFRQSIGIAETALKSTIVWDQTRYYNIWAVSEIDGNDGGNGIQGWAYFSGAHGNPLDGCVLLANELRDVTSVTLTHEMGHALNVFHTFEGDANGTACPTNATCSAQGDLVCDTPPHIRSASNCNNTGTNACDANSSNGLFVFNYMDYSSCGNAFTSGQAARMVLALTTDRASFLAANGNNALVPPGAPTMDILPSASVLCGTGQSVTLFDNSRCIPNTWLSDSEFPAISYAWTISNGVNTYNSSVANPTFTLASTGVYNATVTVTTALGSTTHTENGVVVVVSGAPTAICTPTSSNPSANYGVTVSRVRFHTFDNLTSEGVNGVYQNYACSKNTVVQRNGTYPLNITVNGGSNGTENFEVYIDYNNNGILDAAELVGSGSSATPGGLYSTTVTIPNTAVLNTMLRMRVIGDLGIGASDRNCSAPLLVGDVEDYGVYVSGSMAAVSIAASPGTTITYGTNVTFTPTPTNGGGAPAYQWFRNGVQVGTGGTYAASNLLPGEQVHCRLFSNLANVVASPATSNTLTMTVTGPPLSDFKASQTKVCSGNTVAFTDLSLLGPTAWSWSFPGGTPSTSTAQNPTVTYSTPGTYNVTLTASNGLGTGTTNTKTAFISVLAPPTAGCTVTRSTAPAGDIGILRVQLASINHVTPYDDAVMGNFLCSQVATLDAGTTYAIGVQVSNVNNQWVRVYIDYNRDGDFVDAGETIFSPANGTGLRTGTFTTPAAPLSGQLMRMRVITDFLNTLPGPCTTPLQYGQVEEYGIVFNVVPNTAPVLSTAASPVLNAVQEDASGPAGAAGTLVSALVDLNPPVGGLDNVTDPDAGAVTGIAITAADASFGAWSYSINGGTSWSPLGTPTATAARLLAADANTRLYFQPFANFNGTLASAITFRAWDRTTGTNGATGDASVNGGTTAYSTALETASLLVTPLNDAPALNTAATPTLPAVNEDAPAPSGAMGTLVSALVDLNVPAGGLDNVSDVDAGAVTGLAITTADAINGTWYYSLNGGATWSPLGPVTATSARLLAADASTRVYFQPSTDYNGNGSFTFQAWDQTSGTNGSLANPSVSGGVTAFSTAIDVVTVTVTPVNDAPVLNATLTPTLAGVSEDAPAPSGVVGTLVSALVDFTLPAGQLDNVSDVDGSAVTGIAIVAADVSNGTWYYSTNGGTTWAGIGTVTSSSARLLAADASTRVYFQPNANFNGSSSITFRAWDQTSGTNGATADASVNGGTTAYSTATDVATITVSPLNDAPTATNLSAAETYTEDVALNLGDIVASDIDNTTVTATLTLSNPAAGSLSTGTSGAVTSTFSAGVWTASGAIANVNTLLAGVIFTPAVNFNASFSIATNVSDGTLSVGGSKAVNGIAVNDAPVLTLPGAQNVQANSTLLFSNGGGNGLGVADVDAVNMYLTLSVANGTLTLASLAGINFLAGDGTGDAFMELTGTISAVNSALNGLAYLPNTNYSGSDALAVELDDLGGTGTGGVLSTSGNIAITVTAASVQVAVRAMLEGPYASGTGTMTDALRTLPGFPLAQPYNTAPWNHTGTETVAPAVLAVSGNDAVVDWVLVELRSSADNSVVVARTAALLQRDGDVVPTTGSGALTLQAPPGNYHVVLRHRNHLGVMTAGTVALAPAPTTVDLTLASTTTFGTGARKDVGGVQVLWAGDVIADGVVRYTGGANDRDLILVSIGGVVPTTTVNGYRAEDVNLDGVVKYTGGANDRDIILQNIGGVVPTNVRLQQLP